MEISDLVNALRTRPRAWMPDSTYAGIVTFMIGYDTGRSGGLLNGFQELVELKYGEPSNVIWWSLVPRIAAAGADVAGLSDGQKVDVLLDLLDEFLTVDRGSVHKLRRIYSEWAQMAVATEASRDLLRYSSSPPPDTITIDAATERLGMSRREVLRMIRSGQIRHVGRRGPDVMVAVADLEQAKRPEPPAKTSQGA